MEPLLISHHLQHFSMIGFGKTQNIVVMGLLMGIILMVGRAHSEARGTIG
jgi:hypothetical protein